MVALESHANLSPALDLYERRMQLKSEKSRELINVVQETIDFARALKGNPHQFVDETNTNVPIIDLSQADDVCADALFAAATEWGFFQVVGHGLPQELVDAMFETNKKFMSLDQATKMKSGFAREALCGYDRQKQVHPSSGVPDFKENFLMAARKGAMDGLWPEAVPEFEQNSKLFMEASHQIGTRILKLLELKLGMREGTVSDTNTLWGDEGKCVLRLLHYPPTEVLQKPGVDQWRAAPHTDFASLTLLFQRPGEGGLQCAHRHPSSRVDATTPLAWQPVAPIEGAITCNIGDMLMRWSGDRLVSNLHRVAMPSKEQATKSRYSIAFFMQADDSTVIESNKYKPCTAREMVQGRVRAMWASEQKR